MDDGDVYDDNPYAEPCDDCSFDGDDKKTTGDDATTGERKRSERRGLFTPGPYGFEEI